MIESIQKEVARIDRLNLMMIKFTYNENEINIESKDGLILFRIIQECINNVLKHSRAKNMNIDLVDSEKNIQITLKDDGIGFENDGSKKGSGLLSMQKRANLIHTDFQLNSEKGTGTSIILNYNKI